MCACLCMACVQELDQPHVWSDNFHFHQNTARNPNSQQNTQRLQFVKKGYNIISVDILCVC